MRTHKKYGEYSHIADNESLGAFEVERAGVGVDGACRVIKHEILMSIKYLVELPNGERRWVRGHNDPKFIEATDKGESSES